MSSPGAQVFYRQAQGAAGRFRRRRRRQFDRWRNPGTVIGRDMRDGHERKSYWLSHAGHLRPIAPQHLRPAAHDIVRLATVVVVYVDGVELVAVQDEGFACALCLNSEEVREEVGRVEVRGSGLFGCGLFGFFRFLFGKRFEVS